MASDQQSKWKLLSRVRLFVTPWTMACQALLSMAFSSPDYEWVAVPFSRGSSQSRDWLQVCHTAGTFFTRHILYSRGSPRILEYVTYPFSSRSFWPRNRTGISCTAGRFFASWATREALWSTVVFWLSTKFYEDYEKFYEESQVLWGLSTVQGCNYNAFTVEGSTVYPWWIGW